MNSDIVIELFNSVSQNTLRPFDDSFGIAFLSIRWYAIFFIIGIFVAAIIACVRAHTYYKVKYDVIFYYVLIMIPTSLLGARFWSAMIGDAEWSQFFDFRTGGLAIQGGVIFAGIAGLIYFPLIFRLPRYHVRVVENDIVYIRKPSLWIMVDAILPCILIGQAIGRWGNFFNGEIYGQEVSADQLQWLKVIMPGVFDKMQCVAGANSILAPGLTNGAYYQPLFLYESIINTLVFAVIYFLLPLFSKIKIGVIGSLYLITYAIIRFSLEPLRFGDPSLGDGFQFIGTYIINGILLPFGIVVLILAQFVSPKFRDRKILFSFYCKFMRLPLIYCFKWTKSKWIMHVLNDDPKLEHFGYKKEPDFNRKDIEWLYYGDK